MGTSKTFVGILGGVAIGAIVGVLLAPDKGTNTRKKIIKKSSLATEDLKDRFDKITNTLSEKLNSLVSKSEELTMNQMGKINLENIKIMNKDLGK